MSLFISINNDLKRNGGIGACQPLISKEIMEYYFCGMKQTVYTPNAPEPIGPYSQANRAGDFLFVSGQIAINPVTQQFTSGSASEEAVWVMKNIAAILDAANCSWSQVCKTTIFLLDMADFPAVNSVYSEYFDGHFPARETVQVAGLPKNARVEISVIVYLGK